MQTPEEIVASVLRDSDSDDQDLPSTTSVSASRRASMSDTPDSTSGDPRQICLSTLPPPFASGVDQVWRTPAADSCPVEHSLYKRISFNESGRGNFTSNESGRG